MPKHDAAALGAEASAGEWSPCDALCTHGGPLRVKLPSDPVDRWIETDKISGSIYVLIDAGYRFEAKWRVLTVHHLDGDRGNSRWWNLLSLCQRCHLYIQGRVIPERPWILEHTDWFKPYVAGFYAWYHAGAEPTRAEVEANLEHWLQLGQPWMTVSS